MQSRSTVPAAKYGPTPLYGQCEAPNCPTNARATCSTCDGHYCLAHVEHPHDEAAPDSSA